MFQGQTAMMNKILIPILMIRFFIFVANSLFWSIMTLFLAWLRFIGIDMDTYIIRAWGKTSSFIYGVKRLRIGKPKEVGVYVAPHSSFWDIIILSSELPGFLVSKAEVVKWPAVGIAAKATRTIFIDRSKGTKALKHMLNSAQKLFKAGKSLILFPEGTRMYEHMGRFKKGAFYVSFNAKKPIIPVILHYIPKDNMIFRKKRDFISELFLQSMTRKNSIRIEYLAPVYPDKFESVTELKDYVKDLMVKRYKEIEQNL